MTTYYLWNGSSGEASPYNSWGTAAHSITTLVPLPVPGDTVYIAHDHTETATSGGMSLGSGSNASNVKVVCGTRTGTTSSDTGISGLAVSAAIANSATAIGYGGPGQYVYGVNFSQTSTSTTTFQLGGSTTSSGMFDACSFTLAGNNISSKLTVGQTSTGVQPRIFMRNCGFKFGAGSQLIGIDCNLVLQGGYWIAGGATPTNGLFNLAISGRGGSIDCSGFDFTNLPSSFELVKESGNASLVRFRNCKFPTGWLPVQAVDGSVAPGGSTRVELINYSIGTADTNYRFYITDLHGVSSEDTAVYRTAGARDEATQYSMKMVSTANSSWPGTYLRSPQISQRVLAGSHIVSVHIVSDSGAHLNNKDVWMEIEYLGDSGTARSLHYSTAPDLVTNSTSYTSSGEAWTGTGSFANVRAEKLTSPTIVFAENGYVLVTVCLGLASKTIYSDFKVEVT